MLLRYIPRFGKAKCTKLLLICLFTGGFLLFSNAFNSQHVDAKAVPPHADKDVASDPEQISIKENDHQQPLLVPVDQSRDVPIMRGSPGKRIKINKDNEVVLVEGSKYPQLSALGRFIPQRRIIHLDLKGGAYKVEFFTELFIFFKRIKATGVMIEWEDMFPFTGKLASATNGYAYKMEDVEFILKEAQRLRLQVIPLVQTFGHLEWILKLENFAHLREDQNYPQVVCIGDPAAWTLVQDMIDQVANVHKKYGMPFFHMGADEVFQIGVCNASISMLDKLQTRERLMLWHISRVASHIKEKHDTSVLAWHDMLVQAMESDLYDFNVTNILEPVLWSYAEDLDIYLPSSTWNSLRSFGNVWGSSAWKGADGPARFNSNPIHYIKNHQSWVSQFNRVYKDFDVVQGLIMAGWSRYDHLAVLAELLPVALPSLSMSMETIIEARILANYPATADIMECVPNVEMGYTNGCKFPGNKVYELINSYHRMKEDLNRYKEDYELNGWMSRVAEAQSVSSKWYLNKITPILEQRLEMLKDIESRLRFEMDKIFFKETIDEFIFTYMGYDLEWLSTKVKTAEKIGQTKTFPKRPLTFKTEF